ncbi:AAA family ATPase [Clostridium niameyense]|uniref:AAA family ATPase n=1 Tax=Clostridium niameyense TaxID=1622073 RepID=UPI00067F6115|nr:AAA family ATPase [Clostridium niameyense]
MRQSAITQFQKCPYKYKLQYVDNLKTIPSDDPANALVIGTAIHYGAETESIENMLQNYYQNFNILTDAQINEAIKLEYLLPQVLDFIKQFDTVEHEVPFQVGSFHGTADLLAHNKDGTVDLYDYKYSNNIDDYMEGPQLHIYKYFLELCGYKVNKMAFIFIPKTFIRQKKTEDLYQFRKRLLETLKDMKIQIKYLEYDQSKVTNSLITAVEMLETKEFKKNPSRLCDWCEFKKYCFEGVDYMILPKNERRDIKKAKKRKMWIYGPAFSGKTTMLDSAPSPLNLNTDGNIEFVTMPYISIKDEVTVNGRITKRKFAWEVFKDAIEELEKKQNDFQTIIVDLLEDTREMCRVYKYDELGIQHESDSGFGKGWDIIKTEYLSTMRRFFNLDYGNLVVLSQEDISKDITKKNGQNVTRIAPNIQEAIANKIAGMVDIVARVVVDGDERTLNFKSDEVIFGGGRLKGITKTSIPLSWDELMKVYDEANAGKKDNVPVEEKPTRRRSKKEESKIEEDKEPETTPKEEETPAEETIDELKEEAKDEIKEDKPVEEPKEEKPRRRRRKKADEK